MTAGYPFAVKWRDTGAREATRQAEVRRIEKGKETHHVHFGAASKQLANVVAALPAGQLWVMALAQRFAEHDEALTESKLSGGLYKDISGLTKRGVAAAVFVAIEDGLLHRGAPGRGGGKGALLLSVTGASVTPARTRAEPGATRLSIRAATTRTARSAPGR